MSESSIQTGIEWPVPGKVVDCDDHVKRATFSDFKGKLNFLMDVWYHPVFTQLVLKEIRARNKPVVLDIGCGNGVGGFIEYTQVISAEADQLWGIEPDDSIEEQPGVFYHCQQALLEDAELPGNGFDVAYAVFVLEHVQDPDEFFRAVYRALKPGGVLVAITPNAGAFFGMTSRILNRLKLDELVLRIVKRKAAIEEYHYPLASKCNTQRQLSRIADRVGFAEPEILYFQFAGTDGYFPGPLRLFYKLLIAKRRLFNNPASLDSMICRITKPK
jgi:SAM-dependent methyltransferase